MTTVIARARSARVALAFAGAALIATALAIAPTAAVAQAELPDEEPAAASALAAPESLLWDPGPTARCWSVITEPHDIPPFNISQNDCGSINAAARTDTNAACWPGGATPYVGTWGQTCPSWRFNSFGWDHRTVNGVSEWGKSSGGFDMQVNDKPGGGLSLKLVNNAWGLPAAKKCDLRETAISYDYKPSALKRHPGLHENLKMTYNAKISGGGVGQSSCATENRSILTGDLIWDAPARAGVPNPVDRITIVHYNPSDWDPTDRASDPLFADVLYYDECKQNGVAGICTLTIAAPIQVAPGTATPIAVDFTAYLKKYATLLKLDPNNLASGGSVRAIQVVTSNKGTDTTATIDSIGFTAGG